MKIACRARYDRAATTLTVMLRFPVGRSAFRRTEERVGGRVRLIWDHDDKLAVFEAIGIGPALGPVLARRIGADQATMPVSTPFHRRVWEGDIGLEFTHDPTVDAAFLDLDGVVCAGRCHVTDGDPDTGVNIDVDANGYPLSVEFLSATRALSSRFFPGYRDDT